MSTTPTDRNAEWIEVNRPWFSDHVHGEFVDGFQGETEPGMELQIRYPDGEETTLLVGDINDEGGTCNCCDEFKGQGGDVIVLRYRRLR